MKKRQEGTGKIKRRFESGRWCVRVHVLVRVPKVVWFIVRVVVRSCVCVRVCAWAWTSPYVRAKKKLGETGKI